MERNITTASLVATDANWAAYLAVGSDGKVTGSAGDAIYGLVYGADGVAGNGEAGTVVTGGEFYATASAAIAQDAICTGAANGKIVTYTAGTNQGFLMALEAASADGDVIRVKFI